MKTLQVLGWNDDYDKIWHEQARDHYEPARVIADYGSTYKVALPGEITAETSGKMQHLYAQHEMPKIGDWVAVQRLDDDHGLIHEVLPRKTEISRKQPGEKSEKQVLAANVDVAFLIQALDHDFSPQRLQRYMFQLSKSGIRAVIVLNKSDIAKGIDDMIKELESFHVDIVITSAKEGEGLEKIVDLIEVGETAVLLGSSGVGKSTITNALLGDNRQATSEIRQADSKGRHTTTHRELFVLPNGGLIIDTPGLKELQLWGTESDLNSVFPDIEKLTLHCKFSNCSHSTEPGCAVVEAEKSGALESVRLQDYFKFQNELRYLASKVDENASQARKESYKKAQKQFNQILRDEKK